VLVLIMVVVVAIVSLIGDRVSGMYTSINSGLSS
jgi:Flp pilus assembly pilin Flp